MKLKIIFLITIFLFNFRGVEAYTSSSQIPSETIVWNMPKDQSTEWKEISRNLSENEGVVERIPVNQKKENWHKLVAMQYMKLSTVDSSLKNALDQILESIKMATVSAYPGNKVTWNVIERNNADVIYEWILHKPYGKTPAQHEVSRIILTKEGFHRIGATIKHEEMSQEEKEIWIRTFRNSVEVVSLHDADDIIKGLSIIDQSNNFLDIGSQFNDWEIIDMYNLQIGSTIIWIPSSLNKNEYVTECIEVTTLPTVHAAAIKDLVDLEKKSTQQKISKNVDFSLIQRNPREVFYSFTQPRDNLIVTHITRTLISDQGYFSICYKRGLSKKLKNSEILLWKDRLEAIKINSCLLDNTVLNKP